MIDSSLLNLMEPYHLIFFGSSLSRRSLLLFHLPTWSWKREAVEVVSCGLDSCGYNITDIFIEELLKITLTHNMQFGRQKMEVLD